VEHDNGVRLVRWDDIPKEHLNDLLDRRIICGKKIMLAHIYLKKSSIVPLHQHENEQVTYILEGELLFWIGTEESDPISVKAGEVLCIPPNVPHKAQAVTDTLDMDVFCPPRQDWLDKTDDYLKR